MVDSRTSTEAMTSVTATATAGNDLQDQQQQQVRPGKLDAEAAAAAQVVSAVSEAARQTQADSGHDSSESSTPESPSTPDRRDAATPETAQPAATTTALLAGTQPSDVLLKLRIIPAAGAELVDVHVGNGELAQELVQVLLERDSTCHRTCFVLTFNGQPLDVFTELRNVEGLVDGSTLYVQEQPYTIREARLHMRHIRDVLRSAEPADFNSNGTATDFASPVFLPSLNATERRFPSASSSSTTGAAEGLPPDFVLPGYRERPLSKMMPFGQNVQSANGPSNPSKQQNGNQTNSGNHPPANQQANPLNLAFSPFNPPPGPRRLKGDVLYAIAELAGDATHPPQRLHLTCSSRGWFVNASCDRQFRPAPHAHHSKLLAHSLVDLLSAVNAGFRRTWKSALRRRAERHLFERLPTPYAVYSWLAPSTGAAEQAPDGLRAEESVSPGRTGFEESLPGQVRDWNEELQTTHQMPKSTFHERLVRDRSIFKIHSDFVAAAVRGAREVVDGNVGAINPADEPNTHMFIWNNIFFSLGFDVKDHYKELGGDAAAHAAASQDLQGVRAFAAIDDTRLCTLGVVVLDYRGQRVVAQSIIPGILDREQEQSVVYGSTDFGKTVSSSEQYHDLLKEAASMLHILPHAVESGKDDKKEVTLYSSYETKGIVGNDSRTYVLDLLRTFPPDVCWRPETADHLPESLKALGFPRTLPHRLASIRHEAVQMFVEQRQLMFVRSAYALHMRNKVADGEEKETEDKKEDEAQQKTLDGFSPEVIAAAAAEVGSLRTDAFDVRFNPDCFETGVKHAEHERLDEQRRLVVELAEWVVCRALPELIGECLRLELTPIDGEALVEQLHARGINARYLGTMLKLVEQEQRSSNTQADWLRALIATEILARAAKHVLRDRIRSVPLAQLGTAAAHFLNCLLGSDSGPDPVDRSLLAGSLSTTTGAVRRGPGGGSGGGGGGGKKRKQASSGAGNGGAQRNPSGSSVTSATGKDGTSQSQPQEEWPSTTGASVWRAVIAAARSHFAVDWAEDTISNCDQFLASFAGTQRTSLLRRVCRQLGIQIAAKDYGLEGATPPRAPIHDDDILNVYPLYRHRQPPARDAKALFAKGRHAMETGALREAYECFSEAVQQMSNVYGSLHPELTQAQRMLARISYIMGEVEDAFLVQHKATLCAERTLGLDHHTTITEYISLAHFAFANLYVAAALRLLYRARYLLAVAHSERHPLMAQIDANIGVILYAVQEYDASLRYLQSSEAVAQATGEPKRFKRGILNHIMARAHSCRGDFRSALACEKETFTIYQNTFGSGHDKTKESGDHLRHLTQQAVAFQKRVADATRANNPVAAALPPIQIQQASLHSILEVLNIVNGIIIISFKSGAGNPAAAAEAGDEEKKTDAESGAKKDADAEVKAKLADETLD